MVAILERIFGFLTDIRLISGTYRGSQRKAVLATYLSFYVQRALKGRTNVVISVLGFKMDVPDFHMFFEMFREIFIRNTYYFYTEDPAPSIIDCGGNIGMSVLYFKWLYPRSKITVFEPSPSTIEIIRKNVALNTFSDVELVNKALGEKEGTLTLYNKEGDKTGGGATVMSEVMEEKAKISGAQYEETQVSSTILSPYILSPIAMLKLDIEGAEGGVFRELETKNVFHQIDRIVMEYHYSSGNKDNMPSEMIGRLEKQGYSVQIFLNDPENRNTRNHYNPVWHCILLAWRPGLKTK